MGQANGEMWCSSSGTTINYLGLCASHGAWLSGGNFVLVQELIIRTGDGQAASTPAEAILTSLGGYHF